MGIPAGVFAVFLACMPKVAIAGAEAALTLCLHVLIPSLFPFFVCANVLLGSSFLEHAAKRFEKGTRFFFGVGGAGAAAVLMGFISGYPSGALISCRLYQNGRVTKTEAERLLAFTNNAGPLFVIGAVGTSLYGNTKMGVLLLAACTLASLCTGAVMRFWGHQEKRAPKPFLQHEKTAAIPAAVVTMGNLCGYVIFFAVIRAFAKELGMLRGISNVLSFLGLSEASAQLLANGIFEISTAFSENLAGAPEVAAAVLSFGGLSVTLQTAGIVRSAGLSMKSYLFGKFLSAGLSSLFCRILLACFTVAVRTSAQMMPQKTALFSGYFVLSAALSVALCLFLSARKSGVHVVKRPRAAAEVKTCRKRPV